MSAFRSIRPILAALLLGLGLSAAGTGLAQTTAPGLVLTQQDREDLARVERYLTDIRTLRSRFLQVSSTGAAVEGDLFINRPGKLRFEYDPPFPILLLADGLVLLHYDKELKEETYLPLWETPLWFLLRDEVELDDSVRVAEIERGPASLRITVEENADDTRGRVTLVFEDSPLLLKKWIITDPQGITTEIALLGPRIGIAIDEEVFDRRKITGAGEYDPRN